MMTSLKAALAVWMLGLALACARAQESTPFETPASPVPGAVKPPTARAPLQRRSVQQVIAPTPRIVTDASNPTLLPRPPAAMPAAPLPPPARINRCDAGGCTDTSGARYNGGVGNTLIGPQGQLCTRGVVNAQCF